MINEGPDEARIPPCLAHSMFCGGLFIHSLTGLWDSHQPQGQGVSLLECREMPGYIRNISSSDFVTEKHPFDVR